MAEGRGIGVTDVVSEDEERASSGDVGSAVDLDRPEEEHEDGSQDFSDPPHDPRHRR